MKKALFSLYLCVSVLICCAQPKLSTTGVGYGKSKISYLLNYYKLETGDYVGIQYPLFNNKHTLNKDKTNSAVCHLNEDITTVDQKWFSVPLDYNILTTFEGKDLIFSFYSKYDKRQDEYTLYLAKFDKNERVDFNPQKLTSFNLAGKDGLYFFEASSEDNSKHAFSMIVADKKAKFKGLWVMVLDDEGNPIWNTIQKPDFDEDYFNVSNIEVSNDGEVYFGVKSYSLNTRKSMKTEESLYIIAFNETEYKTSMYSSPIGSIGSMKIKLLRNGNIFICGYYNSGDTKKKNMNSVFSITFDPFNEEFGNLSNKHLASIIANDKGKETIFPLVCNEIFELENGKIVLMGEQAIVQFVVDSQTGSAYYRYQNAGILYHFFDEDGVLESSNSIAKYQMAKFGMRLYNPFVLGISYETFVNGNDIYLIYNDNEIFRTVGKVSLVYHIPPKKNCLTMMRISQDQKPERTTLNYYKQNPIMFRQLLYADEHEAILSFTGKKACTIHKLSY